jgi:hypothetical protein
MEHSVRSFRFDRDGGEPIVLRGALAAGCVPHRSVLDEKQRFGESTSRCPREVSVRRAGNAGHLGRVDRSPT